MRLTFNPGHLWQNIKRMARETHMLWTHPREAPPSVRRYTVAFARVNSVEIVNNARVKKPISTFVPELFELASVRGLKAQQTEDAWLAQNPQASLAEKQQQSFYRTLYHENGTAKSPWHLANLPVFYNEDDQASGDKIREIIKEEYVNRIGKDQALPPIVYKYLIVSDYAMDLPDSLEIDGVFDTTLDIQNPGRRTRLRDRAIHYTAQRGALIFTLVTALGVTASPGWFIVAAMGAMLAEWCVEEFGAFGIGEILHRDMKSIFAKEFRWGRAISVEKTIKTGVLLAAIGSLAIAAFSAGWSAVIALPLWGLGQLPWVATALTGLQFATAGFVSCAAGMMAFLGAKEAAHFFWGVGIWNKQIDFSGEAPLPPLTQEIERAHDLNREKQKLSAGITDKDKLAKIDKYIAKLVKVLNKADKVATTEEATSTQVNTPSNVLAFSAQPQAKQDETQTAVADQRRSRRLQAN